MRADFSLEVSEHEVRILGASPLAVALTLAACFDHCPCRLRRYVPREWWDQVAY